MTRINLVPPTELTRQHLLAELREIPRVSGLVKAGIAKGKKLADYKIPASYTLGSGHVTFFYDKMIFIRGRHYDLIIEALRRGYNIQYTDCSNLYEDIPICYMGFYTPTAEAIALNRARIQQRLAESEKKAIDRRKKFAIDTNQKSVQ